MDGHEESPPVALSGDAPDFLYLGNAFVAIKYALQYVTPVQLLVFRFIPAAFFFFLILVKIRGFRLPLQMSGRDRWRLALAALFGIPAYNLALNWGEQHITAGMASLIIALSPGLIFIFSLLMLGGATHVKRKALGLAISFAGLAYMILRAERVVGGDPGLVWLGALATLGSPLSWALYTILGKPLVERYNSVQVTAWATLLGAVPILFLRGLPWFKPRSPLPLLLVGDRWLVLFCTVFAFAVWYWALKRLGATETAVFIYLIPRSRFSAAGFCLTSLSPCPSSRAARRSSRESTWSITPRRGALKARENKSLSLFAGQSRTNCSL
jgi:drug/metabolite transporter (DMT)-like permease